MTELLASLNTVTLWGAVAVVIQAGLTLGVVLRVILTRHPPASSLAWIVLTLALPYVGFILYLLIGEKPIGRWREFRMRFTAGRRCFRKSPQPTWENSPRGSATRAL